MRPALYYIICICCLLGHQGLKGEYRYRLTLDGKPGSEMVALSERALERRQRLGIEPDSADLCIAPQYLEQLQEAGLQVVAQSRWRNTVVVMQQNGKSIASTLWDELPFVTKVERLTTSQRASAPATPCTTGNLKANGDCGDPLRQLNAIGPLYEAGYRGQGMLIAVLDAGFTHVDQMEWLMSRVIGSRDMYEATSGTSKIYTDHTHGACCLSIMASPQSHGVWGTAQEAEYYLIRTETSMSESQFEEDQWIAGAELADSLGVDVISSSVGYYEFDLASTSHTYDDLAHYTTPISQGAAMACSKGILVCNAAGNEGEKLWHELIFPADVEEVITVGGVDANGEAASFTSHGFIAPYVKPDVSARAVGCYIVNANDPQGAALHNGSGTSYATPLIAGLCASLWSAVPTLKPEQIREVLRRSASHSETPDSITGYGIPDFGTALQLALEMTNGAGSIEQTGCDPNPARRGKWPYGYDLMGRQATAATRLRLRD